jgi:CHAD domain-containing protein
MKKKKEKEQIRKRWNEMMSHFSSFLETKSQDELHQFRVSVKKIRSLLRLLESGQGNKKLLKGFKPVKKIFKKAGHIRNAHLNLQLSARYNINDVEFIKAQRKVIEEGIIEFQAKGSRYTKKLQKARKRITRHIHQVDKHSIRDFYKTNLNEINGFLKKPRFNEDMHACRKRIKFLLHNQNTAGKTLKGEINIDAPYLDQLQESIGKWHDNVIVIETFSLGEPGNQPIVDEALSHMEQLQENVLRDANDFAHKAIVAEPANSHADTERAGHTDS